MNAMKVDVLVIGAGPAGVMAAAELHKNGFEILVVEKQQFPRFVIGESLLPRCMDNLKATGMLDAVEKHEFQKKLGFVFYRNGATCGFDFSEQFTDGWSRTWEVTRADFDKILADELAKRGVSIEYETTVTDVVFDGSDSSTTVEDKDGNRSTIHARFIVDASGYGRVLPHLLDLSIPSTLPTRDTLFTHFIDSKRPDSPENERIVYHIPETEVYVWIIPFSNGNTSVGFVGASEKFEIFPGTNDDKLRSMIKSVPGIAGRFGEAEMVFPAKRIHGFSVGIKQLYGEGYVLTGNATEFLDPIFSSGVTFATESGLLAGKLVSRELQNNAVDWQTEYVDYVMHGVEVFKNYVEAWYDGSLQDIFFSKRNNPEIRRQICSILAGYVWDYDNPCVKNSKRMIRNLAKIVRLDRV